MTATPTMTPKTTITGVMLACIGAATLVLVLNTVQLPGIGGWRGTNAVPAAMTAPVQTRGSHAADSIPATDAGDPTSARARN